MAVEKMIISKSEIDKLKQRLQDSDYKIIKQSEASFAKVELPYTDSEMQIIYNEREALRERIRALEL